jgi:hypothetical protein
MLEAYALIYTYMSTVGTRPSFTHLAAEHLLRASKSAHYLSRRRPKRASAASKCFPDQEHGRFLVHPGRERANSSPRTTDRSKEHQGEHIATILFRENLLQNPTFTLHGIAIKVTKHKAPG